MCPTFTGTPVGLHTHNRHVAPGFGAHIRSPHSLVCRPPGHSCELEGVLSPASLVYLLDTLTWQEAALCSSWVLQISLLVTQRCSPEPGLSCSAGCHGVTCCSLGRVSPQVSALSPREARARRWCVTQTRSMARCPLHYGLFWNPSTALFIPQALQK